MPVRCPQCGREVQTGKSNCPYCFAKLERGKAPHRSPPPSSTLPRRTGASARRRRWSWRLYVAAFVSLIGLAIIVSIYQVDLTRSTQTPTAAAQVPTAAAQAPMTTVAEMPIPTQVDTIADIPTVALRTASVDATKKPTVPPTVTSTPLHLVLCAPTKQIGADRTAACYAPNLQASLLKNGYDKNIVSLHGQGGLRASQSSYTASIWVRDLDYAISGYSYALNNMSVLRESIELFLNNTRDDGVVPELFVLNWAQPVVYQESWDSMPNLIHAVYVYVAKTGDQAFYQQHRETVQRVGEWIAGLDSDGDGLPDRDIFPYGYYDSTRNSVQHTYALAKFYAAFNELAALESYIGNDGSVWEQRAARLRAGFHRPLNQGGYWPDGQDWPVAWHRTDGDPVNVLETFGVFEALRSGLIAPSDGQHYSGLIATLHAHLAEMIDGPTPMHLALGGYPAEVLRRNVDPPVPQWMLDASAPWVVGLAAPAYTAAGYPDDARTVLQAYEAMARTTNPPVLEFAAGPNARYGSGNSHDAGRAWDNAMWFLAVYSGHYGLTMTPAALIVQPHPFEAVQNDGIRNLSYQGAVVQLMLDAAHLTYHIKANQPITVILRPMGDSQHLQVDGGKSQNEAQLQIQPEHEYVVVSERNP